MEPIQLVLDQLQTMARGFITVLPQMTMALVVLFLTWLISRLARSGVNRLLRETRLRKSLKNLFAILATIGIWTVGFMIAALIAFPNLTPTKLLTGLGIGSVAIGFAFKDIFENFLAGIIILLRRDMRIGDFIECEGIEGKVEDIMVRETHIRKTDGQLIIVPNSLLFKNPLRIMTDQPQRRVTVICGVAYGEDVDQARDVIREAVTATQGVITSHSVEVFAQAFADSSINFEVTWWCGSQPLDVRRSRDAVIANVKRALDEAGIEIPFPYRTLTFAEPLPISTHDQTDREHD